MPVKIHQKNDEADKNHDDSGIDGDICTKPCVATDFDSWSQYKSHMRQHIRPLLIALKRIDFAQLERVSPSKNVYQFRGENGRRRGSSSINCSSTNGLLECVSSSSLPSPSSPSPSVANKSYGDNVKGDQQEDEDHDFGYVNLCSPSCSDVSDSISLAKIATNSSTCQNNGRSSSCSVTNDDDNDEGSGRSNGSNSTSSKALLKKFLRQTSESKVVSPCNGDIVDPLERQSPSKRAAVASSNDDDNDDAIIVEHTQPPAEQQKQQLPLRINGDDESPTRMVAEKRRHRHYHQSDVDDDDSRHRRLDRTTQDLRVSVTPCVKSDQIIDETLPNRNADNDADDATTAGAAGTAGDDDHLAQLRISLVSCLADDAEVVGRRDSSDDVIFVSAAEPPPKKTTTTRPPSSPRKRKHLHHNDRRQSPEMRISLVSCMDMGDESTPRNVNQKRRQQRPLPRPQQQQPSPSVNCATAGNKKGVEDEDDDVVIVVDDQTQQPQFSIDLVSCFAASGDHSYATAGTTTTTATTVPEDPADEKLRRQFGAKDFQIRLTNYDCLNVNCVYQVVCRDVDPQLLEPTTLLDGQAAANDDGGVSYYYAAAIAAGASSGDDDDCVIVEPNNGATYQSLPYASASSSSSFSVHQFAEQQIISSHHNYAHPPPPHPSSPCIPPSQNSLSQTVSSPAALSILTAESREMLRLFGAGHFMLGLQPPAPSILPSSHKPTPFPRHRNLLKPPPVSGVASSLAKPPRKRRPSDKPMKRGPKRLPVPSTSSPADQMLPGPQLQLQQQQQQQQLQHQQQHQVIPRRKRRRRPRPNSIEDVSSSAAVISNGAPTWAVAAAASSTDSANVRNTGTNIVVPVNETNKQVIRRPAPTSSKLLPQQFDQLYQRHCQQLLLQTLMQHRQAAVEKYATSAAAATTASSMTGAFNGGGGGGGGDGANMLPSDMMAATFDAANNSKASRLLQNGYGYEIGNNVAAASAAATVKRTPLTVRQPPYANVVSGRGIKRKRGTGGGPTSASRDLSDAGAVGGVGAAGGGTTGTGAAVSSANGLVTVRPNVNGGGGAGGGGGGDVISLLSDSDDENDGGEVLENLADFMEVVEMD